MSQKLEKMEQTYSVGRFSMGLRAVEAPHSRKRRRTASADAQKITGESRGEDKGGESHRT